MNLLFLLWLALMGKSLLFWLYLWQLKEYHVGRVRDYANTAKGRNAFLSGLTAAKLVLLAVILAVPSVSFLVFFLYSAELVRIVLKKLRVLRPVLTVKSIVLGGAGVLLLLWYGSVASSSSSPGPWFLVFDLLSPFLFSLLVLSVQPVAVAGRNRILRAARRKRKRLSSLRVVGITGSYGKTSTKEFASYILGTKFRVAKTQSHANSEVGISYAILHDLKETDEIFVCEMGAYGKGGIRLLSSLAEPEVGIITGISSQHLAVFGSQEAIVKTKFELISSLPQRGVAILNKDSELVAKEDPADYNDRISKVVWCSTRGPADLEARDVRPTQHAVSFLLSDGEKEVRCEVPVLGAHSVENLVLAAAAALEFNMTFQEVGEALNSMPRELSQLQLRKGIKNLTLVDSSYSANAVGVIADIEYLALWEGRRFVVMPSLIELGPESKRAHETIGEKLAQVCEGAVITSSDGYHDILKGALRNGMAPERIRLAESVLAVEEAIDEFTDPGDTVLLAGRLPSGLLERLLAQ